MYDELVKRMWECASGECFNCSQYTPTTNASICQKELMKQAADAIEDLSKLNVEITRRELKLRMEKPRWIPVTERLPEMRDAGILKKLGINLRSAKCLIVINDGKDQIVDNDAELRDGKWHSDTLRWLSAGKETFEVTHWMPLPQPPKEK